MEATKAGLRRRWARAGPLCAVAALAGALQGCALYGELMRHGGSLPLGEGGAEWRLGVPTPAGGAVGVQFIRRF